MTVQTMIDDVTETAGRRAPEPDLRLDRAAVLGAGVMGAAIAAHLANAGLDVLLLDVKTAPGGQTADGRTGGDARALTDRAARGGLAQARKAQPPAFFTPRNAARIRTGNLEDDLGQLAHVDWVVEAVVENLEIKRGLFARVAEHLAPHALLTSNTSGLTAESLAEVLPAERRPRFFVTHFFNPPRYLHLLELVAAPGTDAGVLAAFGHFAERRLGKGVVTAKDTPNFIGNRIGLFSFMHTVRSMQGTDLSVAAVDALTGPLMGRPRSATFRTADLVGLDTLLHVAGNLHARLEHDPARDTFVPPPWLADMAGRGWLGVKSGRGFYSKTREGILMLDPAAGEYVPRPAAPLPAEAAAQLAALRKLAPAERLAALVGDASDLGRFAWSVIGGTLHYAASCIPEIADDLWAVDRAMRWGFGWKQGPFELWDALGVEATASRLADEGQPIPALVDSLLSSGGDSFYEGSGGATTVFAPAAGTHVEPAARPRVLELSAVRAAGRVIQTIPEASLLDLGDDVLCVEFHGKMNVLGPELGELMLAAVERVEREHAGLVVGNQGEHFSAGANLALVLGAALAGDFDGIERLVRSFQELNQRLRFCRRPVVVAPHGRTLGGGCEITLHAAAVCASAESYIGLVEVGAGLIPAGGGCKELLRRADEAIPDGVPLDPLPLLMRVFETIGMGAVATSGAEARRMGFLRPSDVVVMNSEHVLHDARELVLGLHRVGWQPPAPRHDIRVMGADGLAALRVGMFNFAESGTLLAHDAVVGEHLARILCGGDGPARSVSEDDLLDLEREAFLSLCGEAATQARMKHLLETGKPLRN